MLIYGFNQPVATQAIDIEFVPLNIKFFLDCLLLSSQQRTPSKPTKKTFDVHFIARFSIPIWLHEPPRVNIDDENWDINLIQFCFLRRQVFHSLRASAPNPERRDEHHHVPDDSRLREGSPEQQHYARKRARLLRWACRNLLSCAHRLHRVTSPLVITQEKLMEKNSQFWKVENLWNKIIKNFLICCRAFQSASNNFPFFPRFEPLIVIGKGKVFRSEMTFFIFFWLIRSEGHLYNWNFLVTNNWNEIKTKK